MMLQRLALLLVLMLAPSLADAELTMFWRAEGTTLDEAGNNDYALGDSTAGVINSPAINTTAVKFGTNGIHINATNEYYQFDLNEDFVTANAGTVAFWINWQAFTTDASAFVYIRGNTSTNYVYLRGTNTNELRLVTNTAASQSTHDTSAANISTGVWYFVCFAWNDSANTRRISVWDNGGTLVETRQETSMNFFAPAELATTGGRLRFGEGGNVVGTPEYYLDNVFVGNGADCDTFYNNREITSYSAYSAGGAQTFGFRLRVAQ